MPKLKAFALFFAGIAIFSLGFFVVQAGGGGRVDCSPEGIGRAYESFSADYPLTGDEMTANAYAFGAALQDLALTCGYLPDEEQVNAQIERTLLIAPVSMVIQASSVGQDIDAALAEIEELNGDTLNGQLLYNGLAMGLDGADLGCAGCHDGRAAPIVEGTWTRVDEIRLAEAQFADYDVTRYLVESILNPHAYIVPEYTEVQMPNNFWARLDAQQLADLIAYLESQDQELE